MTATRHPETQADLDWFDQQIRKAYRNMAACDRDHHPEGATMWYSMALDLEQRLATYRAVMEDYL